jgi:hypothetical protein
VSDTQINRTPRDRGRITHDPRGTAVWDWAIATGVLAKATTEQLLSALGDASTLSLEPSREPCNGWSGDPYNRSKRAMSR